MEKSIREKILKLIQMQELPIDPEKNIKILKESVSPYLSDRLIAETLGLLLKEQIIDIKEDNNGNSYYIATEKSYWKGQVLEIPLEEIFIPQDRLHSKIDEEREKALKDSLKKGIQVIPAVVRKTPLSEFKYRLIDGENRIRILKDVGKKSVLAIIMDEKTPDLSIQLMANWMRGEIDYLELAKHIEGLMLKGYSSSYISEIIGYSPSTVRNLNYLNLLPPTVKEMVRKKEISPEIAIEIRKASSSEREVVKIAKTVVKEKWDLEKLRNWRSSDDSEKFKQVERPLECRICRVPTGTADNGVWIRFCKECWSDVKNKLEIGKVDVHKMEVS